MRVLGHDDVLAALQSLQPTACAETMTEVEL